MKVASEDPAVRVLAGMCKYALQTINEQKRQQMRDNHVDYQSILNYEQQRNSNGPTWYNPVDWIMNGWRYLRNDNQFEQNRELLKDRSMERYNKQKHAVYQKWLDDYYNKQQTKAQAKPTLANNAR